MAIFIENKRGKVELQIRPAHTRTAANERRRFQLIPATNPRLEQQPPNAHHCLAEHTEMRMDTDWLQTLVRNANPGVIGEMFANPG